MSSREFGPLPEDFGDDDDGDSESTSQVIAEDPTADGDPISVGGSDDRQGGEARDPSPVDEQPTPRPSEPSGVREGPVSEEQEPPRPGGGTSVEQGIETSQSQLPVHEQARELERDIIESTFGIDRPEDVRIGIEERNGQRFLVPEFTVFGERSRELRRRRIRDEFGVEEASTEVSRGEAEQLVGLTRDESQYGLGLFSEVEETPVPLDTSGPETAGPPPDPEPPTPEESPRLPLSDQQADSFFATQRALEQQDTVSFDLGENFRLDISQDSPTDPLDFEFAGEDVEFLRRKGERIFEQRQEPFISSVETTLEQDPIVGSTGGTFVGLPDPDSLLGRGAVGASTFLSSLANPELLASDTLETVEFGLEGFTNLPSPFTGPGQAERTEEFVGRTEEGAIEVGEGVQQDPGFVLGAVGAGLFTGFGAGSAIQRAPGIARAARIRARGGPIVDLEDVSDPPRELDSGLPGFTEQATDDPQLALREFQEQAGEGALSQTTQRPTFGIDFDPDSSLIEVDPEITRVLRDAGVDTLRTPFDLAEEFGFRAGRFTGRGFDRLGTAVRNPRVTASRLIDRPFDASETVGFAAGERVGRGVTQTEEFVLGLPGQARRQAERPFIAAEEFGFTAGERLGRGVTRTEDFVFGLPDVAEEFGFTAGERLGRGVTRTEDFVFGVPGGAEEFGFQAGRRVGRGVTRAEEFTFGVPGLAVRTGRRPFDLAEEFGFSAGERVGESVATVDDLLSRELPRARDLTFRFELEEQGQQATVFSARQAEDVGEFGGFDPTGFEAPIGIRRPSEPSGLFFSADLSPLRLPGATGESSSFPRIGFPNPRFRTGQIAVEADPDLTIMQADDLIDTDIGPEFSDLASRQQSFIKSQQLISPEQEVIAPPGSPFEPTGQVFGVRVGGDVIPGRIFRRGDVTDVDDPGVSASTFAVIDSSERALESIRRSLRAADRTPFLPLFAPGLGLDDGLNESDMVRGSDRRVVSDPGERSASGGTPIRDSVVSGPVDPFETPAVGVSDRSFLDSVESGLDDVVFGLPSDRGGGGGRDRIIPSGGDRTPPARRRTPTPTTPFTPPPTTSTSITPGGTPEGIGGGPTTPFTPPPDTPGPDPFPSRFDTPDSRAFEREFDTRIGFQETQFFAPVTTLGEFLGVTPVEDREAGFIGPRGEVGDEVFVTGFDPFGEPFEFVLDGDDDRRRGDEEFLSGLNFDIL